MTYLISILPVRGFELICPLFGGAIIRPLREGAQVERIESDLTKSYGAVLRTVDTICTAVSGGPPQKARIRKRRALVRILAIRPACLEARLPPSRQTTMSLQECIRLLTQRFPGKPLCRS